MAEKPNRDLAQTMRCLLHSTGLGSQFWSYDSKTLPPIVITLQHAGFRKPMNDMYPDNSTNFHFKLLSPTTTIPTKGAPSSAGYDICSSENKDIPPNTQSLVHTKLAFKIPKSYYGQLKLRSGLAFKNNIHVQAGTIDSDYRG